MPNKQGYSLIEISVAISIFIFVFILGANFIIKGFQSTTFSSEQDTAVQNARRAMENLTKDIREARSSEKGDYPLSVNEEQNFIWYGDINNNGITEKIKYFLLNSTLQRIVVEPGAGNLYSGPGATTTIAQYVNNQAEPIFTYFDANNNETDEINNIRLINVKLKINVTPERAPFDYYLETDIQLRNLKDNL